MCPRPSPSPRHLVLFQISVLRGGVGWGGVGWGGVGGWRHNNPKYWDRKAFANSVDPDQMPQNEESD